MKRVRIEQIAGDFLLKQVGRNSPFSTSDAIYFRSLLSAEHDASNNSFLIRRQALGRQGVRYLFDYLKGAGFALELDSDASKTLDAIHGGREVLEKSRRAGLALKQHRAGSIK